MKYNHIILKIFWLALGLSLLSGCAMGPKYQPAPLPPEDYGLVYLMRGDIYNGGGWPTKFSINNREVASLYDGGYSWIHLQPGEYEITASFKTLKLNVEAGKTYYLEYHQENVELPNGSVQTRFLFEEYSFQEIQAQLESSRYNESTSLEKGELTTSRRFINTTVENGITLKVVRRDDAKVMYPFYTFILYDDHQGCEGSYQTINRDMLQDETLNFPANNPLTFHLYMFNIAPGISLSCNNKFTFIPEPGNHYTAYIDIEKASTRAVQDVCIVTVVENTSTQEQQILNRSTPIKWTSESPGCSASDLNKGSWSNQSKQAFECRIKIGNKWRDC